MKLVIYAGVLAMILLLAIFFLAAEDFDTAKRNYDAYRFSKAFPEFLRLAQRDDKRAQFFVGRMYHLGEGVPQDKCEAAVWYAKSAKQGFARAQNNLAVLYIERGNRSEAMTLLTRAAAQGLTQAQSNLQNIDKLIPQTQIPPPLNTSPVQPDLGFRPSRFRSGLGVPSP